MKLSEITALLRKNKFRHLTPDEVLYENCETAPYSYYKYRGDLHVNIGNDDMLGFAIIAKKNDIGLGRYIYSYRDEYGDIHEVGTYYPELFFEKILKWIS